MIIIAAPSAICIRVTCCYVLKTTWSQRYLIKNQYIRKNCERSKKPRRRDQRCVTLIRHCIGKGVYLKFNGPSLVLRSHELHRHKTDTRIIFTLKWPKNI